MDPIATPNAEPLSGSSVSDTSGTSDTPGSPSDRLARMSPAERSTWRNTGEVPGTSAQGDGDAGGDADVVEDHSVAPTPAPAAAAPGADASAAGRTLNKRKQTAQERINDLARHNYRLEGELKALREQLNPSPSRPAAAATPPVVATSAARAPSADPDEPHEEDFSTYKEYVAAAADYRIKLARNADRAEQARDTQQRQRQEIATAHDARVAAFAAAHPDYDDVIRNQTEVFPTPLLADAVLHSDLPAEIAYYLNTHVEEYRALVNLAPGPMLKALGKLEQRLEAASPAASGGAVPNRVSRAPAPPTTLGGRPATPGDDVDAAVARGDVGSYLRNANARELAARR